jgi:pSer/pThr/pTyr-binding forkhead associated (FHA) protein
VARPEGNEAIGKADMLVILSVIHGGPRDARLSFLPGEYVFGRSPESDVVLVHRCASRRHFLLRVTDEAAFVRDLFSRNRTMVNQQVVTDEYRLRDGDTIYVGGIGVRFGVHVFPGESGVLASDASRPAALYQHGASPDEPTAVLRTFESETLGGGSWGYTGVD